ncbi:hypothetical protein J2W35_001328 [Variovorax boronicumulans]|uniref:hypothetical protein n=1 Tax=Variovorax boronicumulans TaxID=436515 RepID=UPI0027827D9C|nr:hypothetical protein [Variovorax boronicumulans]MDQ0080991.1 hypothetical protein [Variovorax boronicumulans]
MYTLDDYNLAKIELDALNQRWENYSGNNPNKYKADIAAAGAKVRAIESALKSAGILQRTPQEELEHKLDLAYPNAQSKQIVEFEEKRYIRRFMPLRRSISGRSVTEWAKFWEETNQ